MVNKTKHIIFAALAVIIAGCNPGIIDVPPAGLSNIKEYFWHTDSAQSPRYVRTIPPYNKVVAEFSLMFDQNGSNSYYVRDAANMTSVPFKVNVSADKITISHLSPSSLISLPEGYKLVSDKLTKDTIATALKIKTVLVTGRGDLYTAIALDTAGQMYISSNSGESWDKTEWGSTQNGTITALALSPSTGYVYAGTYQGAIFVSTDKGSKWTPFNAGKGSVAALYVSHKRFVYVSTFSGQAFRISENTGKTDTAIFDYKGTVAITSLAVIDSSLNGINFMPRIIGGIKGIGLAYFLLDGKSQWLRSTSSLTNVFQIVPHGGSSFLAIGLTQSGVAKVVINDDSSLFSSPEIANLPQNVRYLSGTFNGGTSYIATEGGEVYSLPAGSVTISSNPSKIGRAINSISSLGDFVIAATDGGVAVSTDQGKNWSVHTKGLETIVTTQHQAEGELTILLSGGDSLRVGSSWKAGFISYDSISTQIPITAKIFEHFAVLTLPDSVDYKDVFGVTYAPEVNIGVSLVSLKIYFAKKIGPIMIDQYLGTKLVNRTYYKK